MTQIIDGPKGCLLDEIRRMDRRIGSNNVEIADHEAAIKLLRENNEALDSMIRDFVAAAGKL